MRGYSKEYILYRHVAYYLRVQYPNVLFHFDPTGLRLTKTQAGMLKAIQWGKGYPDLVIPEPCNGYHGLFLELKAEGIKLYNKLELPVNTHIGEQLDFLVELRIRGYKAEFAVGFDDAKKKIDEYLKK